MRLHTFGLEHLDKLYIEHESCKRWDSLTCATLAVSQLVTFDLWRQAWIVNTLIHAAALGVLWLMAKYRVAARWIPN